MVEMKPSQLKKPKEDKAQLLNSTVSSINSTGSSHNSTGSSHNSTGSSLNSSGSSEFDYEDNINKKYSAWCMFISACLFIVYFFLVILLSWIARGYLYSLFKRYLHINSINDLVMLDSNPNTYEMLKNNPNIAYEMLKNKPEAFKLNLNPHDNIDDYGNSLPKQEIQKIENSIFKLDKNLPYKITSDEEFTNEPSHVVETDALNGIINNMSDYIMNELELLEKTLKSKVEELGDSSINMNDIDIFSDHIIGNITNTLEEEIKFVEKSLKTNKDPTTEKEILNKNYADYSTGIMGFLTDIFKHTNEKKESIEQSDVDTENYDPYSLWSIEPRFDIMEPMPEPDSNHNNIEAAEDVILNSAVESIRNLFGIDKTKIYEGSSDAGRVVLKPDEDDDINTKLLQEYLEIFGLVLAVMSLAAFILLFLIHHCLEMSDRRKVIMRYKSQENEVTA